MKLIDVHAHLQFPQFDDDREEVIRRTREAGVGVINVGTDLETSRQAIALTEKYEGMWAIVGLHPTDAEQGFDDAEFRKLARHPQVVAIGECGLDYFRVDKDSAAAEQQKIFSQQIALANELGKPLMLHIRQAYRAAAEILKSEARVLGNVHFFSGSWPEAKLFLDLGFTLSFAGPITFPPKAGQPRADTRDEVVKRAPLAMIMAETDSPFAAPLPYRGRRNEPLYVTEIVEHLAFLRGEPVEKVAAAAAANALRVFGPALA